MTTKKKQRSLGSHIFAGSKHSGVIQSRHRLRGNILPQALCHKLSPKPPLTRPVTKLTSYSSGNFKVVGCNHLSSKVCFPPCKNKIPYLHAYQKLEIIKIVLNINCNVTHLTKTHPKLFQGPGCLKNPYRFEIESSVAPVVCPPLNQP